MYRGSNPYGELLAGIAQVVGELGVENPERFVAEPPREEFGDFAVLLHRLARSAGRSPGELGEELLEKVRGIPWVGEARVVGGYLNIFVRDRDLVRLVLEALAREGEGYGLLKAARRLRVVVEYVSANPVHPLHVGAARNAALGIAISRILEAQGHEVQRRYYVNDMGVQPATLVYGLLKLGEYEPPPGVKPDHWYGQIYAITSTVVELVEQRRRVEELRSVGGEEYREELKKLDRLLADAARLRELNPDAFDRIAAEVSRSPDPWAEIQELVKRYEEGDPEVSQLFRRTAERCIEGFAETLRRFGAEFDKWDWESDLVRSGEVARILEEARRSPYYTIHKGAPALDFSKLLEEPGVRERLGIPRSLEIPPLILQRSDGTTLYTVRDIAYTLRKFREFGADRVYNVIASEQLLPQAQLRLALYALGYRREAENLVHYSYEIVNVSGARMSSRRGRYVTLDELMEEARRRVLEELRRRGAEPDPVVAERIGVAAIKFALLQVSPSRPVTFRWENVLDFERNSAPYLLYTYARCMGILRKAREEGIPTGVEPEKAAAAADSLGELPSRRRLYKFIARFPQVFLRAAETLDPSTIAVFLLGLADTFNSWYDEDPVLREGDEARRALKMGIVQGVRVVLLNGLRLLGIEPLKRM